MGPREWGGPGGVSHAPRILHAHLGPWWPLCLLEAADQDSRDGTAGFLGQACRWRPSFCPDSWYVDSPSVSEAEIREPGWRERSWGSGSTQQSPLPFCCPSVHLHYVGSMGPVRLHTQNLLREGASCSGRILASMLSAVSGLPPSRPLPTTAWHSLVLFPSYQFTTRFEVSPAEEQFTCL